MVAIPLKFGILASLPPLNSRGSVKEDIIVVFPPRERKRERERKRKRERGEQNNS